MKVKVTLTMLALILVFGAGYFGRHIAFALQWPLFEALRTTASIIFAVVGAWFAIIYPERLKKSFRGGDSSGGSAGIHNLFTPIVHSTAILAAVLLVGIGAPLLKQFDWVMANRTIFRGVSYGLLVFLTLWQLLTVVLSLTGPDILKRFTSRQEASKRAAESLLNPKNKK
ncbi:hypothetical protein ACOMDP_12065 [Pantoea dispersa]|uniref:hypothetical protein n=1 Tax=Pantoea dispersa TaxID=59814 RepID=UPI003B80C759